MDLSAIHKEIEDARENILLMTKAIARPNSAVYSSDFVFLGSLKRGISLSRGFQSLIRDSNYTCAAALLRMQIDTAARIHALSYVDDPNNLADRLMKGERFDRQLDSNGNKLKDFHLIKQLNIIAPWVSLVYERTSNFIHLSVSHFYASISEMDDEGQFVLTIGAEDKHIAASLYEEITSAFAEATRLVVEVAGNHIMNRNIQIQRVAGTNS